MSGGFQSQTPTATTPPAKTQSFAVLRNVFIAIMLALLSADVASIAGSQAQTLHLPTSSAIPFVPLFVIVAYWGCILLLRHGRLSRFRTAIATAFVIVLAGYPLLLLRTLSTSLPLTRELRPVELEQLQGVFPHPHVCYSASGKGARLRIRRCENAGGLRAFLDSIQVLQEPTSRGQSR